jgi:hypothetical protein
MFTKSFPISFEYRLDQGKIVVNLGAQVEVQNNPPCYFVRNIRAPIQGRPPAIPDIILTKKASIWVHLDSLRPTDLTVSIGAAIDTFELQHREA